MGALARASNKITKLKQTMDEKLTKLEERIIELENKLKVEGINKNDR